MATTYASRSTSQPQSWSKLFGDQRKREFRTKYGKINSYESPITSLEQTFSKNDYKKYESTSSSYSRGSRSYEYDVPTPRTRSASVTRLSTADTSYQRRTHLSPTNLRSGNSVSPSRSPSPIYIPSASGKKYHSTDGSHTLHLARRRSIDPNVGRMMARADLDTDAYFSATSRDSDRISRTIRPESKNKYSFSSDRYHHYEKESSPDYTPRRGKYTEIIDRQKRRRDLQQEMDRTYTHTNTREAQDENIREIVKRAQAEDEYAGIDYRTMLDGIPKKYRSQSVNRYQVQESSTTQPLRSARASSISRLCDESENRYHSSRLQKRASSVARYSDYSDDYSSDIDFARKSLAEKRCGGSGYDVDIKSGSTDISAYVLDPNSPFEPSDIKVQHLPSGQKATTYTKVSQHGSGDQHHANEELEKVIQKTQSMQQQMRTLEDFVRRNRQYFPEETYVYQQIRFFQLNEEELARIGEAPDAVVYGVKIKEKLVVPPGTEVVDILKRYYGDKDSYEVSYSDEYQTKGGSTRHRKIVTEVEDEEEETRYKLRDTIRKQVEKDFEDREAERMLKNDSYESKHASKHVGHRDKYNHLHPHVTPEYIKSYYTDAGLEYDSIYNRPRRGENPDLALSSHMLKIPDKSEKPRRRYDTAPLFTSQLVSKRSMEGQTIRFTCTIGALPEVPQIMWMKGNYALQCDDRINFTNDYGLLSLEVKNLTKDDSGVYTVKVINAGGETACSATLEVEDNGLEPQEKSGGRERPWFISEPSNLTVEIGQRATFEAQAIGKPAPTFKWQRDNITLINNDHTRIYNDDQGNTKLVIKDTGPRDGGLYFCIADSRAGRAKATATLRVAEKGQLKDQKRRSMSRETTPLAIKYDTEAPENQDKKPVDGTAPWFLQQIPGMLSVHEGDPLLLQCIVDGDPKPRVTWLKEPYRELQYSKRHRVVIDKDKHYLEINSSLKQDTGRFIVVAENKIGKVHGSCWVNINPPREYDEHGVEISRSYVTLPEYEYGMEIQMEHGKMAPRFVKKLPLEIEEQEGENLEVKCLLKEGDVHDYVKDVKFTRKVVNAGDVKTVTVGARGEVTITGDADRKKAKEEAEKAQEKDTSDSGMEPVEDYILSPEKAAGVHAQAKEAKLGKQKSVAEEEIIATVSDRKKQPPAKDGEVHGLDKIEKIELKEMEVKAVEPKKSAMKVIKKQATIEEDEIKQVDKKDVNAIHSSNGVEELSSDAVKTMVPTFTPSVDPQSVIAGSADSATVSTTASGAGGVEMTVTDIELQRIQERRKKMRKMSSIDVILIRPKGLTVEPLVLVVAGIAPPEGTPLKTLDHKGETEPILKPVEPIVMTVAGIEPEDGTATRTLDIVDIDMEEEEISIQVKSDISQDIKIAASESLQVRSMTEYAGKNESRAESVVSETVTEGEESWTEFSETSAYETTEAESDVDTEVEEVIEVKKVTKVTKVMEVTDDGDKTVSKVTEVTTKVTEGGAVQETKERKEETGDDIMNDPQSTMIMSDAGVAGVEIPEGATVTEVRTVTKVRKVIEVSGDGEEKVVSTTTEKTTKVKEGDDIKETKEIVEEKGDAEESGDEESSTESSSEESSSESESSSEEDSDEEDTTVETGKGEVGKGESADAEDKEDSDDKTSTVVEASSSEHETEKEESENVEEEEEESETESEDSDTEDSDSDSDSSSESDED